MFFILKLLFPKTLYQKIKLKASERKRLDYEKEKSILRANLKNNKQNMRNLIKQLRLYIMVEILYIAVMVCPKECEDTLIWFSKIPLEK